MIDHHSISMAASKLSWEDVDKRVKQIGFNNRSQYIQYLVEKDIEKKRFENVKITEIMMLMMMAAILLMLVLI